MKIGKTTILWVNSAIIGCNRYVKGQDCKIMVIRAWHWSELCCFWGSKRRGDTVMVRSDNQCL